MVARRPPPALLAAGALLFRHRGWIPVPFLVALVWMARPTVLRLGGATAIVLTAEGLRLWAARHIGSRSRTRGETVGPLAVTGPYAFSRNPLYLANLVLYLGVALAVGRAAGWAFCAGMLVHYHLVIRWEETRVAATHPHRFPPYRARVARWIGFPRNGPAAPDPGGPGPRATWGQALRAERSTLLAIGVVMGALYLRAFLAG